MIKWGVTAAVVSALTIAAPAGAVPPGGSRGPQAHVLVVRGARSATVDVTFRTRVRPHTDGTIPGNAVTATTKGTYAVVWLQSLDKPMYGAGSAFVPALAGSEPIGWGSADREDMSLPAGRYRVRLVTDGASEVRLPIDGLPGDLVVRPAGRSTDAGRVAHRQPAPGADSPVDRTVLPVTIGAKTTTLLASGAQGDYSSAGHDEICLHGTGPDTPCAAGGGGGAASDSFGPSTGRSSSWLATFYYPGDVTPGQHDAEFLDANVEVPAGYYAFALTID